MILTRSRRWYLVRSLVMVLGATLLVATLLVAPPLHAQTADPLPVVMVHGQSGSAQQYETQAQRFTSNGYPVELLHAFEYDTSVDQAEGGADIDADLDAFIDAVLAEHDAEQVALIGHSRGTSVSIDYLTDAHGTGVDRPAKVARYVNIDGRAPAEEPGGVPTIGIWGEWNSGGAHAREDQRAQIGPDPAANFYHPAKGHTEVATSAEAFTHLYEHITGEPPVTTDVVAEDVITIAGRATLFPQNAGYEDAGLSLWAVDAATGQRVGDTPLETTVLGADGAFGPWTVAPDTHYELALERLDGSVHHFYAEPWERSTHFLRLQTSLPGTGLEAYTTTSADQTNLVVTRQREMWGDQGVHSDRLEIDGLNILRPAISPRQSVNLATFAFDAGPAFGAEADGVTDLERGTVPPFNAVPFITAADVFIPSSPDASGTVEVAMEPRFSTDRAVVNVPDWPSDEHRVTVSFGDDGTRAITPLATPTVEGPIPGAVPGDPAAEQIEDTYPFFSTWLDLEAAGYVEEEFHLTGLADAYDADGELRETGVPYRTRIIVRRPADAADFNGTVLAEWQNVTAGYDLDALWNADLMREGFAWVGVSAQRVGVEHLRGWSPTRYGDLDVTGDGVFVPEAEQADWLSYDIFAQAGRALRDAEGVDPLGGLVPDTVLGIGASQSAGRMTTYHDRILPSVEPAFDGLGLAVTLTTSPRREGDTPIFHIQSETDVLSPSLRRADDDTYRLWEVAGSAHSGWEGQVYRTPLSERDLPGGAPTYDCERPPFSRVPLSQVITSAWTHLATWAADGVAPPTAPPIEFDEEGSKVRDDLGLAQGGIQLSQVAVPTALNSGDNAGESFCFLFGSHVPFDEERLRDLYDSFDDHVGQVASVDAANLEAGYILPGDLADNLADAEALRGIWDDGQTPTIPPTTPPPTTPPAEGAPEAERLGGQERIETAVLISQDNFPDGSEAVVLARQDIQADAVTGTPLASAFDGPVLLTVSDQLTGITLEEIRRLLDPGRTVYVMGGVTAVSAEAEAEIVAAGYEVVRVSGPNRFATATAAADILLASAGLEQVLLADGGDFVPATVAGPAAADGAGAVLLTSGDDMAPETATWLTANPDIAVTAIGGAAAAAAPDVAAVVGADAPALSVAVAEAFFDAPTALGFATFASFPDPLTGGTHIAARDGALLLSTADGLPQVVADYLGALAGPVDDVFVYGGTAALGEQVEEDIATALGG